MKNFLRWITERNSEKICETCLKFEKILKIRKISMYVGREMITFF